MWNVFFLVPVGRGQLGDLLSGEDFEQVFGKIYELSHRVSFQIKTTEAMHYRRYLLQHNLQERKMGHGHGHPGAAAHKLRTGRAHRRRANPHRKLGHAPRQRRQGIHVHLPRRQRLSKRISAHPCGQHPPDAAG